MSDKFRRRDHAHGFFGERLPQFSVI